jgi:predicted MFS family arabinose efflux permease
VSRDRRPPDALGAFGASDLAAFWSETRAGLVTVARSPLLLPATAAGVLASTGWRIAGTVYLLFVYDELGFSPGTLGMVFAVGGVASFVGALATPRLAAAVGSGWSVALGLALFGISMGVLALAPGAGAVGLAILIAHQLGDGFEVVLEVNASSVCQRITPAGLLGRVAGAGAFAGHGAMLLGLAIGGWLGETIGLRATLVVAGCFPLAGALWVALSPLRQQR